MCCVETCLPPDSRRTNTDKPSNIFSVWVLVSSILVHDYDAILVDHGAKLLHPFLMTFLHPEVLIKTFVGVEECQGIMFAILVKSRQNRVGGKSGSRLVEIRSQGFSWGEVNCDFGLSFGVFELKEIFLFIRLLFLASSGVFSHWRTLKFIKTQILFPFSLLPSLSSFSPPADYLSHLMLIRSFLVINLLMMCKVYK